MWRCPHAAAWRWVDLMKAKIKGGV
jgi:hypothetical protein